MLLMLWSAPRSRSTAFFRMMAERGDCTVVHEPFSYLAEFGRTDVGDTTVTSAPELIAALTAAPGLVFAKETTGRRYPEVLAAPEFLSGDTMHAFLIRHPRETIASYHGLYPDAPREKIGFESLHEIYAAVVRRGGREPVVIDAADLVRDPAGIVAAYCARAGIPFRPDALTWAAGDRDEWQRSRRWHADVAASTGFGHVTTSDRDGQRGVAVDVEAHPVLRQYLDYHRPYYERLHARRLSATAEPAADGDG